MKGAFTSSRSLIGGIAGRALFAVIMAFSGGRVLAISMPEIPRSPDMRIVVVSDHMIYNGMDMATYQVSSPHPLDEVLRFYREAWHGVVAESPMNMGLDPTPWTVLAHRDGDFLVTLQLHPSKPDGVYGYIAISSLFGGVHHEGGHDIPMPAGSKVVNEIVEDDPGRRSQTVVVQNDNSVGFNLDFYRQRLESQGWTEVADMRNPPAEMGRPQALMLNRDGEEMDVAVTRSGGMTTVVMVRVRK